MTAAVDEVSAGEDAAGGFGEKADITGDFFVAKGEDPTTVIDATHEIYMDVLF